MKQQTTSDYIMTELNNSVMQYLPFDKWELVAEIIKKSQSKEKLNMADSFVRGAFSMVDDNTFDKYYRDTYGK